MFALHLQLERDTFFVADLGLCRLLLMNNCLFPWLILVPRTESTHEIIDLPDSKRHQLMDEIAQVSRVMQSVFTPDKLNVAALGNVVPQLHIHIIARFANDSAWPSPVWGKASEAYEDPQPLLGTLRQTLDVS